MVDGLLQDLGRLSARNLTTDSDGRTSLMYTAPEPLLGDTRQTFITIVITPSDGRCARAGAAHRGHPAGPAGRRGMTTETSEQRSGGAGER